MVRLSAVFMLELNGPGFGHERIIELCEKFGFSFVLRRTEDINVVVNGEKRRLNDFAGQDCFFEAEVPA
ncbi:MAG: hypothetical protein LBF84_00445, partial [Holosporales bacterium]|nr:hypothetical protein [Holosporales bacterium]